jgi:hypothetical protein
MDSELNSWQKQSAERNCKIMQSNGQAYFRVPRGCPNPDPSVNHGQEANLESGIPTKTFVNFWTLLKFNIFKTIIFSNFGLDFNCRNQISSKIISYFGVTFQLICQLHKVIVILFLFVLDFRFLYNLISNN